VLVCLVVVSLVSPYWRYSHVSYIFRQVGVDLYFSFSHDSTEERPRIPNEELIAVRCFEGVVFVCKLVGAALKIRLNALSKQILSLITCSLQRS
jgi:hypothetical protein